MLGAFWYAFSTSYIDPVQWVSYCVILVVWLCTQTIMAVPVVGAIGLWAANHWFLHVRWVGRLTGRFLVGCVIAAVLFAALPVLVPVGIIVGLWRIAERERQRRHGHAPAAPANAPCRSGQPARRRRTPVTCGTLFRRIPLSSDEISLFACRKEDPPIPHPKNRLGGFWFPFSGSPGDEKPA